MESMQASLEAESKGKAEAMRIKKKLEQDINELEIALDSANRQKADMEKNMKRLQQQFKVCLAYKICLEDITGKWTDD